MTVGSRPTRLGRSQGRPDGRWTAAVRSSARPGRHLAGHPSGRSSAVSADGRRRGWRPCSQGEGNRCASDQLLTHRHMDPLLLKVAQALGVKTVCIPTWEWFRGDDPMWEFCDLFACPTKFTLDMVTGCGWQQARYDTVGARHRPIPGAHDRGSRSAVHSQCRSASTVTTARAPGRHSRLHEGEARRPALDRMPHARTMPLPADESETSRSATSRPRRSLPHRRCRDPAIEDGGHRFHGDRTGLIRHPGDHAPTIRR